MSESKRTTFTRRTALRSGGLAAIAAGLMGGNAVAASHANQPHALAPLVNYGDLAAESRRLNDAVRVAHEALLEADARLRAEIGHDAAWKASQRTDDAYAHEIELFHDFMFAELCRHLPGVAPALRVIRMHVFEQRESEAGVCCASLEA